MRGYRSILFATAALCASSGAHAADALKFGAAPSWVVEQTVPAASEKAKDRPVAMLLHDQQTMLEPGKISTFSELAFKIQKPEGLAAGNLSFAWNPATDTVTVNTLQIRRGEKVIDVLKSGQTFTTLRRESNLELATLDGVLTANIQPEGLQEGDVIVLATTTDHVDPVLKNHVEATFAPWGSAEIGLAHARLAWPSTLDVKIQKTGDLPPTQPTTRDGKKIFDLTMRDVEPVIDPKGAPLRFQIGRMGEATDFRSWADAAKLLMPLFRDAAVVPASGPLHDEVEKIRKASAEPKIRAEQALQLVQERVRYVALLMGQGGYVPAPAETTWSRRFGDCKAKTALLLAILHELGIAAEPVVVNAAAGDIVADRLPSIGTFNHVLVRAHIGGKDYWLDGTKTGDTAVDQIQVPNFGWGLPLTEHATLVHIIPPPLQTPESEVAVDVDLSKGVYASGQVSIDEVHRGDTAVAFNQIYAQLSTAQRDEYLREKAKEYFDTIVVKSSSIQFDDVKRELHVAIKGDARVEWLESWHGVPFSSLGFDPDFDRTSSPSHDAPIRVSYPDFDKRRIVFHLPPGFDVSQSKLPAVASETVAGVEYSRSISRNGDTLAIETSTRSMVPEVPYKEALAAAAQLKALNRDDVYLRTPVQYRPTERDLAALQEQKPQSAPEYFVRAGAFMAYEKADEALADLNAGLALEPKNMWALAMRAGVYLSKHQIPDAKKDLADALAIEPNNAKLLAMQGMLAEMNGARDSAIQSYTKALQIEPNNFQARLQLGWILYNKTDADGAIREFTTLVSQYPKNPTPLAARAFVYADKHSFEAAKKDIAAAEAIDPKNAVLASAKAQVAREVNDYASVIDTYTALIAAHPTDGSNYFNRASAYSALGKKDLALKDTDQAVILGFKGAPLRVLRANILMLQGNRDAVAREADLMTSENPSSTFAFVAAGKTYAALGQHDKAMQAFDRALAIKPEGYVYANRAQIRPKSDIVGRAADIDAALKLDPSNTDILIEKAQFLENAGDYEGALATIDHLLTIRPEAQTYVLRANAHRRTDRAAVLADLETALKLEPNNVGALFFKATMLLSGGAPGEAANLFERMETLAPQNKQYYTLGRAIALYKAGKTADASALFATVRKEAKTANEFNSMCWEKATAEIMLQSALQDCREALKLSPDSGQYLDSLGMALLKLGKLDEALDAYNKAVAKDTGAASLMGRAFVYLRKGDRAHAHADAAAARKLSANIDDVFTEYGLKFDDGLAAAPTK